MKDSHKRHKDSKNSKYIHASLRVKYLLAYQIKSKPTTHYKDDMSLYTWEEDLQIRVIEFLAIVDTSVPTSLFSNPCPIYWLKTMWIIW